MTAYEINPDHRQAQLVRVTTRGLRTWRMIQETQRVWADAVGAEIGVADLRKTNEVVGRLLRVLALRRDLRQKKRPTA